MKKFVFLTAILFLAACGSPYNTNDDSNEASTLQDQSVEEKHAEYLAKYEWTPLKKTAQSEDKIDYLPERMAQLKRSGLDLSKYEGKTVRKTTYELEEKQQNGSGISVTIYEIDGTIIGAVGVLKGMSPGIFPIEDKARLIEEGRL